MNRIEAHNAFVTEISFSPVTSELLLTAGLDRKFCFHDIRLNKQVVNIQTEVSITALDFSSCGIYAGMGSENGMISIYDTRALNKTVSSTAAHNGKVIKHLSFQKNNQEESKDGSGNYLEQYEEQSSCQEVCDSKDQPSDPFSNVSAYTNYSSENSKQVSPNGLSSDTDDSFLGAIGLQSKGKLGRTVNVNRKSSSSNYTQTWKEAVLRNSSQGHSSVVGSPYPNFTGM